MGCELCLSSVPESRCRKLILTCKGTHTGGRLAKAHWDQGEGGGGGVDFSKENILYFLVAIETYHRKFILGELVYYTLIE